MTRFILPVALLSTICFTQSSSAEQQTQIVSERVPIGDLNLTSEAGQARLDARLEAAARRVCQVNQRRTGISEWRASRQCLRETLYMARGEGRVAIARAQVGGTQLAAR